MIGKSALLKYSRALFLYNGYMTKRSLLSRMEHVFRTAVFSIVYLVIIFYFFYCFYFTHFSRDIYFQNNEALVNEPLSMTNHIEYLEGLAKKNRLVEAKDELLFIKNYKRKYSISSEDNKLLTSLESSIANKEKVYTQILSSYSYWSEILKEHPRYRDALYAHSRFAYMLFNSTESIRNLKDSILIDPQFEAGKDVLNQLQER